MFFIPLFLFILRVLLANEILEELSLSEDFTENPSLGRNLNVIVQVKDFHQMRRTENLWINIYSGKEKDVHIGRKTRVRLEKGVFFGIKLDKDILSFEDSKYRKTGIYGIGMDFFENRMLWSSVDVFFEVDLESGTRKKIENKWFRHLHSLKYNHDGTRVLVTSTGFDMIFEYDLVEEEITWEWYAYEHNFTKGRDGTTLTRDRDFYKEFKKNNPNEAATLVHPSVIKIGRGLGTNERCCHISNAFYFDEEGNNEEGSIGVNFAYQKMIARIDKKTKEVEVLFDDLSLFAHGFRRHDSSSIPCSGFVVCDTINGRVIFFDEETFEPCSIIDITTGLPSDWIENDEFLTERVRKMIVEGQDWVQFFTPMRDGSENSHLFNAVDVKRRHILLIDTEKREYRVIPYSPHISIQEVKVEPSYLSDLLLDYFYTKLPSSSPPETSNGSSKYEDEEEKGNIEILDTSEQTSFDGNWIEEKTRIVESYRHVELSIRERGDFEKLCKGEYYPLQGFMTEEQFDCVLQEKKLCDGSIFWDEEDERKTVVKSVRKELYESIEIGEIITLYFEEKPRKGMKGRGKGRGKTKKVILGTMEVESKFTHDKSRHSFLLYGKAKNVVEIKMDEKQERIAGPEYGNDNRVRYIYFRDDELIGGRITSCLV